MFLCNINQSQNSHECCMVTVTTCVCSFDPFIVSFDISDVKSPDEGGLGEFVRYGSEAPPT